MLDSQTSPFGTPTCSYYLSAREFIRGLDVAQPNDGIVLSVESKLVMGAQFKNLGDSGCFSNVR